MISVECYADVTLAKTIGMGRREIDHAGNNSEVIKNLIRSQGPYGMIDHDPGKSKPGNFDRFEQVDEENDVILYRLGDKELIALHPRLEEWILNRCTLDRIDIRSFGLSDDPYRLHKQLTPNSRQFQGYFGDVVRELMDRGDEGIRTVLRYLRL